MHNISMPVATAKWLIKNTGLTFTQIADFCNLHILEVQGLADDEVQTNIKPLSPIQRGLLTQEEIERCTNNSDATLELAEFNDVRRIIKPNKKYMSLAKRKDRQNGICWVLVNYPKIDPAKVIKLFKTTKAAINNVKNKIQTDVEIFPQNPVELNLCSEEDLREATLGQTASDETI